MLKPNNVLLVEDDLAVRDALANLLRGENYNVLVASNSEEAVAKATESQIDVVILDLQLGDEDGWSVFQELKQRNQNLPVIVASAHRNRLEHPSALLSNGALEKPFDLGMLLNLLAQAIAPRSIRRRSGLAACAAALFLSLMIPFTGAAVPALQVTGLTVENGNATITWQGGSTTNQVQFQSSLGAEWQDLDVPTTGSSLTTIVTEPTGFYRVLSMPDVSASADKKAPSTPTGLTARAASCNQVDLSWAASSDSGQNASGLQGYNVYRNGVYLKQVLAPSTSTSDVGLAPSTVYSYSVLAVDKSRNASAKSSAATATTPTCGGSVNTPPVANAGGDLSVTLGSYATFNGGGSFDPDGAIGSYQWDFGDGTFGSGVTVSHAYSGLGVYTVRLTVTDNLGASASDTALATVVALPDFVAPSVALVSPNNGSTVSSTISLSANATDNAGGSGVARVEFYLDNAGTPFATASAAPYVASFDTTTVGNGSHSFYSRAYDAAGNSANSSSVSVTVNNGVSSNGGALQSLRTALSQNGNATVTGVAADHAGNVIAVGYWNGTADFGTGPMNSTFGNGFTDGFVAKYSPQGAMLWLKRIGANGNDSVTAVVIDSQNNIITIGNFQGTVDFGGSLLTAVTSSELFVAKYNSSGALLWGKHYTGLTSNTGGNLAVDGSDNLIVAANCGYNGNFGGVLMNPAGGAADIDVALGKISGSSGSTIWAKRFGGVNWDYVRGVAVDRSGDVSVTGYFTTSTDLGVGTVSGGGSYDIFLAKYSGADGSYRWGKTFGSTAGDFGYGVAVDPNTGNTIMTGLIAGQIDFGGGPINSAGIYVAAFDPSGNYLWAKNTGGSGDSGAAITIDGNGNMAVTGRAQNAVYFGGSQSFIGNGQANCFVASFTLSGNAVNYQWTKFYGSGTDGASAGNAVGLDPSGQVIAGGLFMGTLDFGGSTATAAMAGYSSAFLVKYSH